MFCPKCGNQLPDGAMFCSSCGKPTNVQPTAPSQPVVTPEPVMTSDSVESVAPSAPVFTPAESVAPAAPVFTPSEPVAPSAPIFTPSESVAPAAPVFTPSEPVAPAAPVFTPSEPVMPAAPAFTPAVPTAPVTNNTVLPPKKSKAPLFIGLGIGVLVIAIVALVLILVFTGDDDSEKANASATESTTASEKNTEKETPTETDTTKEDTTDESSTEEPSTEEPSTVEPSGNVDLDAAKKMTEDIMSAFKNGDVDSFGDYLLPGMTSHLNSMELDADSYAALLALAFYDSNYNFLEYEVKDASECDDSFFTEEDVDKLLSEYPEYKKPTEFAKVEVEFTYAKQKSSADMYFAYVDGKCYFCSIDSSNFDLDILGDEDETPSGENTTIDEAAISQMLGSNFKTLSNEDPDGTVYQGDGYHLTVPENWISDTTSIPTFSSDTGNTNLNIVSEVEDALTQFTIEEMLKVYCDTYAGMGCTDIKVGNLQATYCSGYYIEYVYNITDTMKFNGVQFIYPNADKTSVHIVTITTEDLDSDEFNDAQYAAASFQLD